MSLQALIDAKKLTAFTNPATAQDTDALGMLVTEYCHWNESILEVIDSILTDANFHSWAELLEASRDLCPSQVRSLVKIAKLVKAQDMDTNQIAALIDFVPAVVD